MVANLVGQVEAVLIDGFQDALKGHRDHTPLGMLQIVARSILGSVLTTETHIRAVWHIPVDFASR